MPIYICILSTYLRNLCYPRIFSIRKKYLFLENLWSLLNKSWTGLEALFEWWGFVFLYSRCITTALRTIWQGPYQGELLPVEYVQSRVGSSRDALDPWSQDSSARSVTQQISCTDSVVSDSLRPHGLYPTRLLCPWNSPGKNTGVGCHSLL